MIGALIAEARTFTVETAGAVVLGVALFQLALFGLVEGAWKLTCKMHEIARRQRETQQEGS